MQSDVIVNWGRTQKDRDILKYVSTLYTDLCENYNYGYVSHGKIYNFNNDSDENFFYRRYRTISINDFEKYKVGVCWDFTRYQYTKIKEKFPTVDVKNYYFILDLSPDYPTHTVTVVPISIGYVYMEVSWYDYRSVLFFRDKQKLLDTIAARHCLQYKDMVTNKNKINCMEYQDFYALSGLTCEEFMNVMLHKKEIALKPKVWAADESLSITQVAG